MADRRGMMELGSAAAVGLVAILSAVLVADAKKPPAAEQKPASVAAAAVIPAPAVEVQETEPEQLPTAETTTGQSAESIAQAVLAQADDPAADAPVAALASLDPATRARLAQELATWKTRHPEKLVEVIANVAEKEELPVPATFLMSIAWAETRGKILAVSPAGAVGLAQATPAAYLSEGFDGKLFVTNSYLMGTRAYIMKKPLGDALTIVEPLLKRNTAANRARAQKLLAQAKALRTEGMNELEALRPVANDVFFAKIAEMDQHNVTTLNELQRILDRGGNINALRRFHKRVARDYRYYQNLQKNGWQRYERELTAKRDELLRKKYRQDPQRIFLTRQYEAGEYLGASLDARFSPSRMAEFLAAHLKTKQKEAIELGIPEHEVDAWAAALYNGGAVNIRRMQAGLIGRLTETEKYMRTIPERTARLQRAIG